MAYTMVQSLFFVVLLMSPVNSRRCEHSDEESSWPWILKLGVGLGVVVGAGGLAVVAAPVAVAAVGFTGGGIAAGSIAAGAMSTATTTGMGMGVVSTLQAIGATGALTAAQATVVGGGTAAGVYGLYNIWSRDDCD